MSRVQILFNIPPAEQCRLQDAILKRKYGEGGFRKIWADFQLRERYGVGIHSFERYCHIVEETGQQVWRKTFRASEPPAPTPVAAPEPGELIAKARACLNEALEDPELSTQEAVALSRVAVAIDEVAAGGRKSSVKSEEVTPEERAAYEAALQKSVRDIYGLDFKSLGTPPEGPASPG